MWRSATSCAVAVAFLGATAAAQSTTTTTTNATPTTAISTPIPVVGAKTGIDRKTGQPPARLDIDDLWAQRDSQWDLYILALSELQNLNETDESSYFAIAGIHGHPHSAWNGVDHVDGAPITGFCPHGELVFATWHRPYVALFEQILVSHAVDIASRYPDKLRPEYISAAETLRQPYWDWALSATVPLAATPVNLTVTAPEGPKEIPNPLYNYQFQRLQVVKGWGGHLSHRRESFRCTGSDGFSNNATASNENLKKAGNLTSYVYDVFARVETFDDMKSSNFENPHNMIHALAACNGTLSDLNWAAFEPLFMLHHANIDRLVALWQVIHYENAMFTGTDLSKGQFGTPKGTVITADSPLKPFFMADGVTFHTSNSVKNISVFGYTYPELPPFYLEPETAASHVRAQVNALYVGGLNNRVAQPQAVNKMGQPTLPVLKEYYAVEVGLNRSELLAQGDGGGGGNVGLYMAGQKMGDVSVMGMPCDGMAEQLVPLGDVRLSDNGSLFDLDDAAEVVDALLKGMGVGIWLADGTELEVGSIPSLNLTLQDMQYAPRSANDSEAFPEFNGMSASWSVEVRGRDWMPTE
ncbi:hypothetical protein QBC44DRAFT_11279 [Cladorrhinum sp. PSN332]|nr:hypothetical protein QBC44DRAFT_11279 [Cladorrhinum sp. PSN332]